MSDRPERKYLTIAEAAEALGCHPRTIRRRIAEGAIVAVRFGPSLIRIPIAELDHVGERIPAASA